MSTTRPNEMRLKLGSELPYEQSLINKFNSNPKAFYLYIKSKQKVKLSLGPLKRSDGLFTTSDAEVANDLNEIYTE